MKRLLFFALVLAAPAQVQAQDADVSVSPEQTTALQSYFSCIYQQAIGLDDGVSDPQSLTPKIAPTCRYLLGTAAKIFAPGDQTERDGWYKKWLSLEDYQVTKTIWAIRLERRAAGEAAAPEMASARPEPAPSPVRLASATTTVPKHAAARPEPVVPASNDDKPMSEWRRAYIAKHGHEPPAAK